MCCAGHLSKLLVRADFQAQFAEDCRVGHGLDNPCSVNEFGLAKNIVRVPADDDVHAIELTRKLAVGCRALV